MLFIIIISLESYEKGYLDSSMSNISPNLRQLKKEWTYFDMIPNAGSNWTSASLYTSLTGLPAFFATAAFALAIISVASGTQLGT